MRMLWQFFLVFSVGPACLASQLEGGSVAGAPGASGLLLPVSLEASAGEEVSVAQFTLLYDGGSLDVPDVAIGPAAASAGKEVSVNILSAGAVRVLIAGLNQNVIPDGVVAYAMVSVLPGAPPGTYPVNLSDCSLSDPYGIPLPCTAAPGSVEVAGGEGEGAPEASHTADQNGDYRIRLTELLRLIQFYNAGAFHCEPGTEDGYAPLSGGQTCARHDSDYNPWDWQIALVELLRLIQLYNSGGYHSCPEGEDGFCPGASA